MAGGEHWVTSAFICHPYHFGLWSLRGFFSWLREPVGTLHWNWSPQSCDIVSFLEKNLGQRVHFWANLNSRFWKHFGKWIVVTRIFMHVTVLNISLSTTLAQDSPHNSASASQSCPEAFFIREVFLFYNSYFQYGFLIAKFNMSSWMRPGIYFVSVSLWERNAKLLVQRSFIRPTKM